jgi:crotonobetainyl-CoA:carnitine CoA-transferase CaiB-like acyl-CoA transferase
LSAANPAAPDASASAPATGPLSGLRIIDISTVVLGPYCTQFLAEYGADVIKVEAPQGDSTRQIGPAAEKNMASLFLGVNRNKRSIVIDLKRPEGRQALLRLIESADVFVHNMRPVKLARLGLSAAEVTARNPRLIYASLLGFSEKGPYAGRPAYDDVIQGLSGMAALMEMQTGTPRYLPTTVADKVASLIGVQAILAAVIERTRTGRGAAVEVPMYESLVSFGLVEHLYGAHFSPPLDRIGYPRALMPHRRPYATRDGHICIMPYSDQHWRAFLSAVGDQRTLADPRFTDIAARTRNIDVLYERLAAHIACRGTAEWVALCRELDIPAERMNRLEDLPKDPHLKATGHFQQVRDPEMGTLVFPANPVSFDDWSPSPRTPPRLGEHTESVLREHGFSGSEIAALLASGAAGTGARKDTP